MESVAAAEGGLLIYCNTNAGLLPQAEHFTVTLGNTPLSVWDVATVAEAGAGTSYIFLVDVSGSIRAPHFQAIKDTIALICQGLSGEDNVSVVAFGSETYAQPFVSHPDDIQAQLDYIDAINRKQEDTSLYESVFTSLGVLNTNADCRDKKALIVFSDGEEDIFHGITIDEAEIKIRDSRIPMYTVATLGKNPPARYVESAKILGSFARLSAGGRHYIHDLDPSVSEDIAADITASIQNGLIVAVDLAGFESNGEDMALRLELNIPDIGKAGDGYTISTAGLSAREQTPGPQEPAGASPAPVPSSTPFELTSPPKKASFIQANLLWIVIGGAALILAAALILILRRAKPSGAPTAPAPSAPIPVTMPIVRPSPPAPPPGKPRIALRLTKVGLTEEQVFRAEFAGELVIGRDPAKSSLPFRDDDQLSGRHCSICYEPEGIVLRDLGSTNKTFVNGVPIQDRHILENDDVLLIGSMELRVNWETLGV